jgi:hypothetical protein
MCLDRKLGAYPGCIEVSFIPYNWKLLIPFISMNANAFEKYTKRGAVWNAMRQLPVFLTWGITWEGAQMWGLDSNRTEFSLEMQRIWSPLLPHGRGLANTNCYGQLSPFTLKVKFVKFIPEGR